MLRKVTKITPEDSVDKTYLPFIPQIDREYTLTPSFHANLKALTEALIIPDASNIKYKVNEGWESISFDYDNQSFYISFKKNLGVYNKFKTNCQPYLLQDVLHSLFVLPKNSSLAKDTLNKIIESLNSTPYAIRELAEEDKSYRADQRRIFEEKIDLSAPELIARREKYRKLPYVQIQMKLTQLLFNGINNDDFYIYGAVNAEYKNSFPLSQTEVANKTGTSTLSAKTFNVDQATTEYVKRVGESDFSFGKYLDVGFGYGPYFFTLAQNLRKVEFYGVEPNTKRFNTFYSSLGDQSNVFNKLFSLAFLLPNLKPENFYNETVQEFAQKHEEHLGTFDFISMGLFDIHPDQRDEAFKAIGSLLSEKGRLLITCINTDYADPHAKLGNTSLLPFLHNCFNKVSRADYSEDYQIHKFVFVCQEPKFRLQQNANNDKKTTIKLMPHISQPGPVQKYLIPDWNSKKKKKIEDLGGCVVDPLEKSSYAYIWVESQKLKKPERDPLGLSRTRIRVNSEDNTEKKIGLLKNFYPQVTIEADPEQENSYLLTFPKSLHPKLESLLNKRPEQVQSSIVKAQAYARGVMARKRFSVSLKLFRDLSKQAHAALSDIKLDDALKLTLQLQEIKKSFR